MLCCAALSLPELQAVGCCAVLWLLRRAGLGHAVLCCAVLCCVAPHFP